MDQATVQQDIASAHQVIDRLRREVGRVVVGFLGDTRGGQRIPQLLLRRRVEGSRAARDQDASRQIVPPRLEPDDLHFDQTISIR